MNVDSSELWSQVFAFLDSRSIDELDSVLNSIAAFGQAAFLLPFLSHAIRNDKDALHFLIEFSRKTKLNLLVDPTDCKLDALNSFNGKEKDVLKVQFCHPISRESISIVTVDSIFTSKAKPLLLSCGKGHPKLIWKRGDDLHRDRAAMTLMSFFNYIWTCSNCKARARIYGVFPISVDSGFIEFVPGFSTGERNFEDGPVPGSLIFTLAGSLLSAWFLGLRDRHSDNYGVVVENSNIEFMAIDFGHILNEKTRHFDAPRMAITPWIRNWINKDEAYRKCFVDAMMDGFDAIVRHVKQVQRVAGIVFEREDSNKFNSYLEDHIQREVFEKKVQDCLTGTWSQSHKDNLHRVGKMIK